MSTIAFPLKIKQLGAAVAGLHTALDELVARDAFMTRDRDARVELVRALATDRERSRFGAATCHPLAAFQADRALEAIGVIDAARANGRALVSH